MYRLIDEIPGMRSRPGDIGFEMECEFPNYIPEAWLTDRLNGWNVEFDGSLRGNGYEFVLQRPQTLEKFSPLLEMLTYALEEAQDFAGEVLDTRRAGVHVHINVQKLTFPEIFNMMCLYLIFEEDLVDMCGDFRDGNLFCLRVRDAEHLLAHIEDAAAKADVGILQSDNVRYASMNTKSIGEYGSLEFRAMRSTLDTGVLMTWVELLLGLREAAKKFKDPREIVGQFSANPQMLYDTVFDKNPDVVAYNPDNMRRGMRYAQDIAHSRKDWKKEVWS